MLSVALLAGLVVAIPRVVLAQSAAVQQLLADADKAYDNEDFKKAARAFDRAIKSDPKGVPPAGYAKRATIFLFEKKSQDGLRWITGVAEKQYPDQVEIQEQKALILSQLPGRKKDAVDLAEEVVTKNPKASANQRIIGDFYYLARSRPQRTIKAYEAYLKHRPKGAASGDAIVRIKTGFSYLRLGSSATKDKDATTAYRNAQEHFDLTLRSRRGKAMRPNANKGLCAVYSGLGQRGVSDVWSRAITVCDKVIGSRKAMRGDPSPYYNAGKAYLALRQYKKALEYANVYIGQKPKRAQGYNLRGAVYFEQQKWGQAEGQFNRAKELEPNNTETRIQLGKTYSRQNRFQQAINELASAAKNKPNDVKLSIELSSVYLAANKPKMAVTQTQRGLAIVGQENNPRLLVLGGRAHYRAGEYALATKSYKTVLRTDAKNREAAQGLVLTFNKQAAGFFAKGNKARAETLLKAALQVKPGDQRTNFNLGVLYLESNKNKLATRHFAVRLKRNKNDLLTNRLIARAHMASGNTNKAMEHYRAAESEAIRLRNNPILAEIYVEMAERMAASGKLDDAIGKLEKAVRYSAGRSHEKAAKRNLQLLYFQRGKKRLAANNATGAVTDLEGANREPALLRGTEEKIFDFTLARAHIMAGQGDKATVIIRRLTRKGARAPWLKPPYDRYGLELFAAYALYRSNKPAAWGRAKSMLSKLKGRVRGEMRNQVQSLLRSTLELIAYGQAKAGKSRQAKQALKAASKLGKAGQKPLVDHNLAVMDMTPRKSAEAIAAFQKLGDRVPEALVNQGILLDRQGKSREAYDLWVKAKAKGVRLPALDAWIAAKKRIYGY